MPRRAILEAGLRANPGIDTISARRPSNDTLFCKLKKEVLVWRCDHRRENPNSSLQSDGCGRESRGKAANVCCALKRV